MQKIFTTLLFVFSLSVCKAQWVTIPDPNFVAWLQTNYTGCMNGNQMDTTCSGVVIGNYIDCSWENISDLNGIQYFNNLLHLDCSGGTISSLPSLPNLTELDCNNNALTSLPPLSSTLVHLDCRHNQLTSLPALPNSVTYIDCSYNQIANLPTLPNSLDELWCYYNQLTTLPSLPSLLTRLDCSGNLLTSLPTLPNLIWALNCSLNPLTSLPALPNSIIGLACDFSPLTSLPTLPNQLSSLSCYHDQLTSLPSIPASLDILDCYSNFLTSLPDLPETLHGFEVNDNPNLMCIPSFSNFTGAAYSFNISNTGITCLPNVIQHTGYIAQIDTMQVCDVFNLNGCEVAWNIKGNVVIDEDSSCATTNDGIEIPMIKINLKDAGSNLLQQVIANWNGDYSFDTQLGTFKTSVDTSGLPFDILCPVNNQVTSIISNTDSLDLGVNFRLRCKPGFDIGAWNVYRTGAFFPNDTISIHIVAGDYSSVISNGYCNSGVIAGTVKVIINGPTNFLSPLIGALQPTVVDDTLIYSIVDFSLVNSDSDFAFNVITDSTAQSGDIICFNVSVTPFMGDNHISNNNISHCFDVDDSFDPNEKEVSPTGTLPNQFNDWLTYTIHFQNTGTAAAQHIQILDTLDSDIDASTFQLLSYSHATMVQLFGSKVHFNFVNINLPDSTTDSEGSKGYVSYRVKPLANLPLGTTIENTASIYFDFNSPVVTNTVSNLICNPIAPTNLSAIICDGDVYNFNGANISTTGNYSATLNAINGCDSVVNLNLSIETINTNIQQSGDSISVTSNGIIQWFDCSLQQIISGETQTIFVPGIPGNYAAIITQGNCSDTTACVLVSGFDLAISSSRFSVFPNPTDENITIAISQPCENCKIDISNTLGQTIYASTINLNSKIINLKSLPSGVYFIALRSDKMSVVKKLVKE